MHAIKGFRTYWTLNSFFSFLYWKILSILVSAGQVYCTGILVYFCEEFLLLSFFLFFFFLLFQIALAREINDLLQPLKHLGGIHIWIKNNRDLDNIELLFFPLTLLTWAVSFSVKCTFIIYGLSSPRRNSMNVFSAISRHINYDINLIQSWLSANKITFNVKKTKFVKKEMLKDFQ